MRPISATIIPLALTVAIAGCGGPVEETSEEQPLDTPPATGAVPRTLTSACPSHLVDYCKGWMISEASTHIRPDHIDLADRVIIGKKSSGEDPFVWLFARSPEPKNRWGDENKIKLDEITTDDDEHDCLVGKLRLTDHDDGDMHEWHALTLRLVPAVGSDIEGEKLLEICFTPRQNGSPPTECEMAGCPAVDDFRLHGGRAHAQD